MKRMLFLQILVMMSAAALQAHPVLSDSLQTRIIYSGLERPVSVYAAAGSVYLVEQGKHRVLQLDYTGRLLQSTGNRGSSDYQFSFPSDIDATNGLKIYVSDTGNHRIQVFDRHWQLLSSIQQISALSGNRRLEPAFLAVSESGSLLFYDVRSGRLIRMDDNGAVLDEIPLPSEVKHTAGLQFGDGGLLILDQKTGVVHRLSENGFYRSFYPAEGAAAFQMADQVLWTAAKDALFKDARKVLASSDIFPDNQPIVDFYITEKYIFVLGAESLAVVNR